MSIYYCLDLLDQRLEELNKTAASNASSQLEKAYISCLKTKIAACEREFSYKNIYAVLAFLETTSPSLSFLDTTSLPLYAQLIKEDFNAFLTKEGQNTVHKINKAFGAINPLASFKQFRVAKLNQGKIVKLGNSTGECYGFCLAMADKDLSPYKGKILEFNRAIHDYQRFQTDRGLDQKKIKRTRLTNRLFILIPISKQKSCYR